MRRLEASSQHVDEEEKEEKAFHVQASPSDVARGKSAICEEIFRSWRGREIGNRILKVFGGRCPVGR